ncbi:TonB-dependent receptor plug domain-containing protein [Pedobacter sp. KR3-3]|uniref:TonB-dependent receptor plug domain-containing protein n=1 Tax=Pedobacter albus TaxID=3113905 RepID=A0ABU7I9G5_9SPHI|nr:TonB-dependent receptor plug domain-containing protein [Pedobacter sp. KR3-3]MEE1946130.1 TonB-dependent receptor plug domain-containing protein [Pedobacter sp. KR3-3]
MPSNLKLKLSLLSVLAIVCLSFKYPDDPLEKILKQLAKLTTTYPQEKIHLQTDKPYYASGETIFMKAYLVTAEKNEPSFLSAVLYVELIDAKNNIKKKITLPVDKGTAFGNLSLADSLASGQYSIRAYTHYMRNYDERFFFQKSFNIGNVNETNTAKTEDKAQAFDLQFFPEGGTLLANVRAKVGVKAVAANGFGINLSGYIENTKKEKVAQFTTEHAGMGVFALMPQAGEKYTAVVATSTGQTKTFDLPQASASGHALAINAADDNINIRVASTPDLATGKELYVVAQANGVVYASFPIKAESANVSVTARSSTFPTGIVQFTLFDSNSKPIAERLLFVNHQDALKINIRDTKPAHTKSKTELDFMVSDANGNPIDGNFSVAITDMGKVPFDDDQETTILSNLLLTSDLKGYVEKPNYYFNNVTDEKARQLDNLMLTQGWRRFVWKDIQEDKMPVLNYRIEKSLEIGGTIVYDASKKPVPNARVTLLSTTKNFTMVLDTIADANGRFIFDRLDLPDSVTFIMQAKSKNESDNVLIRLDGSPTVLSNPVGNTFNLTEYLAETRKRYADLKKYNMLDGAIQLNEVNIKSKKSPIPVNQIRGSRNLAGQADYVITKDKLRHQTGLEQAFLGIPGIMLYAGNYVRSSFRTVSITSVVPKPIMVLLDGVQIGQDKIKDIPPGTVEGIEVLTSNYNTVLYGQDGYWGVVLITTKQLDEFETVTTFNKIRLANRGFTTIKEFYMPNYDDPQVNKEMEDLRTTVFWQPNLNSDIKGKAKLSYFNAGSPGTYKVTVEGMDAFGNLGRKVYTYEVK